MSSTTSPDADEKLIIIMCGLPARGKSYITRKISNYLNWLNIDNKVFNVGQRRRQVGTVTNSPAESPSSSSTLAQQIETDHNADFFNPNSQENVKLRDNLALGTLDELLHYLNVEDGKAAVFDATNSTEVRRKMLLRHIKEYYEQLNTSRGVCHEYNVLFLESICTEQDIINDNIALKLNGPDYIKVEKELALNDFKERLANYEKCYQTVTSEECDDHDCQYLKIVNITTIESYNINGFLPLIMANFLKSFNITNKNIWLTSNAINDISEISLNLPTEFSTSLQIFTNKFSNKYDQMNFHKISTDLNLDNIHDLILEFEGCHYDNILIQTSDELFINGLLKYFLTNKQLLESNHIDFEREIICINPKLYSVGFEKFDIPDSMMLSTTSSNIDGCSSTTSIPSLTMTRTNSNNSHIDSNVQTPVCSELWQKFTYKNLNVADLSKKLEMLQ